MNQTTTTANLQHPGPFPYMATIAEENEWLQQYNEYSAANAASEGYRHYLKGMRGGSSVGQIMWLVKEVATDMTAMMFEDQIDALEALDAIEGQP